MSEVLNNEIMETEDEVAVVDLEPEEAEAGKGILGKVVVGGLILGGVAVAIKCKKKIADKLTARNIKKLEKQGYQIFSPDEEIEVREVEECFDEDDLDETE